MKIPAKTLIALAVAGTVAPGAAFGAGVEAKLDGQVNRMILYADNGVNDDVLFTDNNESGTRLRLRGSTDLGNGMKAGIHWETDWQFNDSATMDIGDNDDDRREESRIRDLYFSGPFGKLSLGRGNGAANGTTETNFSSTFIVGSAGDFHLGGLTFRTDDLSEFGSSVAGYGAVFNNLDGLSRNSRLRYDTPALGPVVLSADVGQEKFELAARLNQKLADGGKVGAAIGYVDCDNDNEGGSCSGVSSTTPFDQLGLSGALLLGNGFNVAAFWGEKSFDESPGREDPSAWWINVGQKFGANEVAVSYGESDDAVANNDEGKRYALKFVHSMKDHGVEIYASIFKAELDRPGASIEDLNGAVIGSRVKF